MSGSHDDNHDEASGDEALNDSWNTDDDGLEAERTELIPRPAPQGMTRKDRKLWRVLEAERIAAAVNRSRPDGGYRAIRPGKIATRTRFGLGRKGRRTFRDADFAYRSQRWERQQARADTDTKARGVLVLTVLLVAFLVWRLAPWSDSDDDATGTPAGAAPSSAGSSLPVTRSSTTTVSVSAPASSNVSAASTKAGAATTQTRSTSGETTAPVTGSTVFGNGTNTVPTTAPATGSAPQTAPGVIGASRLSSAPSVPAPPAGAVPATAQRTAIGAGKAWFERTCGSSWRQPFGAVITANKAAMTARGWAYANPASDTAGQRWWAGVSQRKETRQCTQVTVEKFTGPGPTGPSMATLIFQADRIVTSDFPDVPAQLEKVSELRTVTRGTDGLWRIGAPEMAG